MNYRELTVSYTLRRLLVGYRTIIDKVQCLRDSLNLPHDVARQVALGGIQEVLFAFGLTVHAISGVGLRRIHAYPEFDAQQRHSSWC